jgi:hypothetical protein
VSLFHKRNKEIEVGVGLTVVEDFNAEEAADSPQDEMRR